MLLSLSEQFSSMVVDKWILLFLSAQVCLSVRRPKGNNWKELWSYVIEGVSYQLSFTWTCSTPRPVRVRTWKLIKASSWSFTAFFHWSITSHLTVWFERWNWRIILPGLAKKMYRSLLIQTVDYINYSILNNIMSAHIHKSIYYVFYY